MFYYKNNFSAAGECSQYNAAIDYAARNNIPVSKILPVTMTALSMELDEKGAEALLKGKRLYEKRDFKVIATMQAGDEKYQANYIEGPKKDFYLQIIDDTAEEMKQKFVARGEIEEDKNGEKCLKISMDDTYVSRKIMRFAENAAQKLAQELGCKRVKMCKDFD